MDSTKLEMVFINQGGNTSKLVIDAPRTDLTETEVQQAMENIITKNIFNSPGGDLVAINSARVITTNVSDIIAEV